MKLLLLAPTTQTAAGLLFPVHREPVVERHLRHDRIMNLPIHRRTRGQRMQDEAKLAEA
jgi:hypothetical protein